MISIIAFLRHHGYAMGIALAFLIALPILGFGFFADDYLHIATIEGENDLASPFDVFVFGADDPERMQPYLETGPYPWFIDPAFKAHFFRPLSSALMVLDHRVFGRFAPAYNAHSLLWRLLLCTAVMLILRRSLPPAAGVLALFLFVLDESHVLPVAWWSNRNSVVAVALGFTGLAAHLRWREEEWRPGLWLSLLAYLGALLASENALGALAYVPAYELFGRRDALRMRFKAMMPASVIAVGYYGFYLWNGYGARFSDIYINPGTNPLAYLAEAPSRFLMLMGTQFLMVPCEMAILRPEWTLFFVIMGIVALVVVCALLYGLWPRFAREEQRALCWLVPGALLATTPGLAAIVSSRVLMAPSLGGAVILALIIAGLWRITAAPDSSKAKHLFLKALMWSWIVMLVGFAALSWPAQVLALRGVMNHLNNIIRTAELDETRMETTHVVVMNAPDMYTGLYPKMVRHFDGLPQPRSWWTMSIAPFDHRLSRTSEKEMELEIVGGALFTSPMERLFRSARNPIEVGESFDLNGLTVTVIEVRDSGPSRILLTFEEPPENERYQLLAYRDGAYRRLRPPAPGEVIELPYVFP